MQYRGSSRSPQNLAATCCATIVVPPGVRCSASCREYFAREYFANTWHDEEEVREKLRQNLSLPSVYLHLPLVGVDGKSWATVERLTLCPWLACPGESFATRGSTSACFPAYSNRPSGQPNTYGWIYFAFLNSTMMSP